MIRRSRRRSKGTSRRSRRLQKEDADQIRRQPDKAAESRKKANALEAYGLGRNDILALQRAYGNTFVQRFLDKNIGGTIGGMINTGTRLLSGTATRDPEKLQTGGVQAGPAEIEQPKPSSFKHGQLLIDIARTQFAMYKKIQLANAVESGLAQQELSNKLDELEDFVENAAHSIAETWQSWRIGAHFSDVRVMAVSGIGTPGVLLSEPMEDLVTQAKLPAANDEQDGLSQAIATGFSEKWTKWQDAVTVPGLPMWPSFAAWPGPMAPPTPNIPMPLILFTSAGLGDMIDSSKLKGAFQNKYEGQSRHAEAVFSSLAMALSTVMSLWLATQQVTLLMGSGPVPSFAPPYVPVGPVINGSASSIPGSLAL